jgi:23S rRNA (guanine745-N1)-methyltransferase
MQTADGGALRCAQGHSFDRAREGYYNLLVVQHKASRDPGDSKAMVAARRRFLDGGFYAPIAVGASEIVRGMADGKRLRVVDAGCGEGHYLNAIAMAADKGGHTLAGIDISKWAIQAAAKRHRTAFWAVATNRHLPFAPGSVDVVLSMFGFPVWESFAAVQREGGRVLLADPGSDHLIELRRIIYPEVRPAAPPSLDAAQQARYVLVDEQRLQFRFELSSAAQIADLMAMTPHDHRAPLAGREALARLSSLALTGDVMFRTLRRTAV